jgi:hypothetical protein
MSKREPTSAGWLDVMWLNDISSMEKCGAISAEEAKQLREAAHATMTAHVDENHVH